MASSTIDKICITKDPRTGKNIINNFKLLKKVGQGQYGKVFLAENLGYGKINQFNHVKYVAIKSINRVERNKLITKDYTSQSSKIDNEIRLLRKLNHPHIVKLLKLINDPQYDKILLILEYVGKEIDWRQTRPLTEINKITQDLVLGLEYLHALKIIHRDIKPSNLLMDRHNNVKIIDFGSSILLTNSNRKELNKAVGTPAFLAPELCQNLEKTSIAIDHRIDIWSMGVSLFCITFNELPFNGNNEFEIFNNILKKELAFGEYKWKLSNKEQIGFNDLKKLIEGMLIRNPATRIPMDDIKKHPFIRNSLASKKYKEFLNFNNEYKEEFTIKQKIRRLFNAKSKPIQIKNDDRVDDILNDYLIDSEGDDFDDDDNDDDTFDNESSDQGSLIEKEDLTLFQPPMSRNKLMNSNSSLNLNSYLTDDNLSLSINNYNLSRKSSTSYKIQEKEKEEIYQSEFFRKSSEMFRPKPKTMGDYLDRLD